MKNLKQMLFLGFVLILSFALAACTDDSEVEPDEGSGDSADSGGESGGDGETGGEGGQGGDLVISEMSDIVSLDPHGNNDVPSSNVRANVYDTLTTLDENMEVQPGLATEWEEVDDTTWRFTLKEGVMFHDGTEFTAEAVAANLNRILDPAMGSPRMFLYEMITDVEPVDDYTVEITTEYPFAPLLSHLAHDAGGMLSPEVIDADYEQALEGQDVTLEEYYELRDEGGEEHEEIAEAIGEDMGTYVSENAIGTGPFQVQSRTPGENVVLERNDDYHEEPVALDTVEFKVVPETAARIAEIETGDSHIAGSVESNNMDRVDQHEQTYLDETELLSTSYVGFNTEVEPLDDERVRQAISHAVDREEIINGVYDGVGIPAEGPLAPGTFGYDENVEGLTYDLERAQELMEEAGYEDGFSIEIMTNDEAQRVNTAVYLQEALSEINIDVEVEQLEWGAYLEQTAQGEHEMFVLGWSTVTGDADYGMYPLFHSSMHGDPGNRSFLENDELDALLEEGRMETDPEARQEIYTEAQEKLVDLAPQINIHHQSQLTGVNNNVENFEVDALGIYQLDEVTLSE